jgi:hypothetical protein
MFLGHVSRVMYAMCYSSSLNSVHARDATKGTHDMSTCKLLWPPMFEGANKLMSKIIMI